MALNPIIQRYISTTGRESLKTREYYGKRVDQIAHIVFPIAHDVYKLVNVLRKEISPLPEEMRTASRKYQAR